MGGIAGARGYQQLDRTSKLTEDRELQQMVHCLGNV
eukprot:COSAG02_NODE_61130_length_269_cov_0.900000_1_plen_35_part_01